MLPKIWWPLIGRPFWRYSDLYSSPYFVPSQELAFGPVSYLWTCFGPQDAVSDLSPPAYTGGKDPYTQWAHSEYIVGTDNT